MFLLQDEIDLFLKWMWLPHPTLMSYKQKERFKLVVSAQASPIYYLKLLIVADCSYLGPN